ncbi:hypothetical protein KR026_003664 [Drosophila bipectinata]|nr:hypothetical protein KR026_003664 [Drosophila bipectinata]
MQVVLFLLAIIWIVPQTFAKDSCAGQPFGSRAIDPQDPYSYVLCLGLLGQIKSTCQDGLKFDAVSQACVVEKKELQASKKETKNELKIEQEIKVDRPVIFNIFGNLNFFGSLWGSSQEVTPSPLTGHSVAQLQFSNLAAQVQPQSSIINIKNVNNSNVTSKDQAFGSEKHSSFESFSEENVSSTEIPDSETSTEETLSSSEPSLDNNEHDYLAIDSGSSESTTEENGISETSTTEGALESSTEGGIPGSESPLNEELFLEIAGTTEEDNNSLKNPTTEPSPESTTEDSISSSVNPLEFNPFLEILPESSTEESISSSENPSTDSTLEDNVYSENQSTEPSLESTTEDSISSSVNFLDFDLFLDISPESSTEESISSSENPSTESTLEDNVYSENQSTEPSLESTTEDSISSSVSPLDFDLFLDISPESSTEESPTTELSSESTTEDSISSSVNPLEFNPFLEILPESSTEESISSTENASTLEDNVYSSSPISSSENPLVTEPSEESTTQENNDSSESPVTEPSLESTTEESISSSENPLVTEPSEESTTQEDIGNSAESPETEPSQESTSEESISSSENPLVTEPSEESTTQEDNGSTPVTVTEPVLTTTTEEDNGSSESPVTEPSLTTTNEANNGNGGLKSKEWSGKKPKEVNATVCTNLPNGVFLRDPTSCNKFYICLNEKPMPGSCPSNLNFDIKNKVCNYPRLVDCSVDEIPEVVTKKPSEDNTVPDCRFLHNGAYIRDPKSCSKFYVCANGRTIARECPRGLYFDFTLNFCNYPGQVQCSIGESSSGSHRPLSRASLPDCSKAVDGTRFGDIKMRNKYYSCLKGKAILNYCSPGKWFDADKQKCILRG